MERGDTPLHAVAARALPPTEALFRLASPRVEAWLRNIPWKPEWGYNSNMGEAAVEEYERVFQKQHPLYTGAAYAIVGGWHFPWPDGDWTERPAESLILTTVRGPEPWLEMWRAEGGKLAVIARVT